MYGNARHKCTKAHIHGFVNGHYIAYLWFLFTAKQNDGYYLYPRLTLLWSSQTMFLKTTFMWILNSQPRCGLNRRMCQVLHFQVLHFQSPSGAILHSNNGAAEAYHSHLNAEFYVKHPNIYMFVDVLISVTMLPWTVCCSQHAYPRMNETGDSLLLLHYDYRTRSYKTAVS